MGVRVEKIILKLELFDQHSRVKQIRLIHIHVDGIVNVENLVADIFLYRSHLVVDEQFSAGDVASKAAHAIIHRDDIGIELPDQKIERLQRRDLAARRNIYVDSERREARLGMKFRIRMLLSRCATIVSR